MYIFTMRDPDCFWQVIEAGRLVLLQVYGPSNEAEYREYREWFLSINTASGGDRWRIIDNTTFWTNITILKISSERKRFHDHWLPLSDEDEEGVWRHYETGEVKFLFSCGGKTKETTRLEN